MPGHKVSTEVATAVVDAILTLPLEQFSSSFPQLLTKMKKCHPSSAYSSPVCPSSTFSS